MLVSQMKAALAAHKITSPSTLERNKQLHQQLLAGVPAARDLMVEANMPLVLDRVESFLRRFPKLEYLRDDLVSEGFMGLINAVDAIGAIPSDDKLTGYLIKSIINAMADVLEQEAPIRISRRSLRRAKERGDNPTPSFSELDSDHILLENGDAEMIDVRDTIYACCQTDEEQTVVEAREKGLSYPEIEAKYGITIASTHRMLKRIHERYCLKTQP